MHLCYVTYNIQGKKQTGLNYSKFSFLDSTGFLASQLIAICAVTICGLAWSHCLCIFVYWSNSTSYSCLYSSLLRYVYWLYLMEGSMAAERLFTGFIADLYHCVLSLVIAIYSRVIVGSIWTIVKLPFFSRNESCQTTMQTLHRQQKLKPVNGHY